MFNPFNKKKRRKAKTNNTGPMNVRLAFPRMVHIDLVQSNDLRHYEVFGVLFSLFFSATTAFWVALATTPSIYFSILIWVSSIFTIFTLLFLGLSIYFRSKMGNGKVQKIVTVNSLE